MAKGDLNKNLKDGEKLIGMSAKNAQKLNDSLKDSAGAVQGLLNVLMGVSDELEGNKEKLGYFEEGFKKGTTLAGALGDKLGDMADKLDKSGTLSNILKGNIKEAASFSNLASAGNAAMAATLVQGVIMLDKIQNQYAKSFGLTDQQAEKVQDRMALIARESNRTAITFLDMHETMDAIKTTTGLLATGLRNEVLEEATELRKMVGLSDEGMSRLALNAQRTGMAMEEQTLAMARGVISAEQMVGANIDAQAVFKEASETTGLIRANLGRSFEEITRVTAKAKAFGLTLQDLANISSNLLDFQSSIEAELTAELFIGRQLNLEKARLYALTGDYEKLQGEIVNQLGSEFEFLRMNTLQKEKFAAAMGMSADQLSNMIFQQGDLNSLLGKAEERGETALVNQLKQRILSEEFQDIIRKVQTTFIDIAGGPLGDIVNMMSSLAQSGFAVYSILSAITLLKIAGLVQSFVALSTAIKGSAVASGILAAFSNPLKALAGLALASVVTGGIISLLSANNNSEGVDVKERSFDSLGAEEMVTLERGSARFHAGESLVRTENFGKMNDTLHEINNSIKQQKLSFKVETHHATRYR